MSNAGRAEITARAEQVLQQRSLERCATRITDPQLRAPVQELAAGRVSAAEFVRFVDTSPQAWRGLQRSITTYLNLSDEQRATLLSRYEQELATVESELDPPTSAPTTRPARPPVDEEDTWENQQSWLE